MTDLTSKLISNTYKQVILVSSSTSNTGVSTSLKAVQTGDGTNSALKIATNAIQISGVLEASGSVSLGSNLRVSDKVCASSFYGDGSNLTGVTAKITGNISVNNATIGSNLYVGGTVTVAGATHLQAAVSVGGAATFGSTVSVSGAAHLKSTVSVGGAATFASTVTVVGAALLKNNVSIGGTLAVAGAPTFTSKATFSNDVSVSGRLDVATSACIGGTFRAVGAATFDGDVSVSGGLVVGGTVTILGTNVQAASARVCASAYHGDGSNLTGITGGNISGNVSVSNLNVYNSVSIGGNLTASGTAIKFVNAAVCASTYYGDGSNLTGLTASLISNGRIGGSLAVSAALTVGTNVNIGGTLTVAGATSLASTLSVGGAANFASTVTVVGATHLKSTVTVGGAANFASTVTVVGAAHLQAAVSVGGAAVFASTVTVVGATHLQSTVSTAGAATFASTVTVVGATHLQSTASVGGAAVFASTVTVVGAATYKSNVSVSGNMDVAGNVSIGGTLFAAGGITYDGDVSVSGNLAVGGNVSVGGTLSVTGAVSLASTLSVGGASNFLSTVTVAGNTRLGAVVSVVGAANFASTVTVVGATHLQSTVSTAGAATFASTVTVVGAAHLQSTASIGGAATFASTVTVVGATHLKSTVTVGGAATFASTVTVVGATHLQAAVSVGGATQLSNTLTVGVNDTGYDVKFFGAASGSYMLWDESTDDLILGGASNMGIGVVAPLEKLHVQGDVGVGANGADSYIYFARDGGDTLGKIGRVAAGDLAIDAQGSTDIIFKDGGAENMRITDAGNVVIGNTAVTASTKLEVYGNAASHIGTRINNAHASGYATLWLSNAGTNDGLIRGGASSSFGPNELALLTGSAIPLTFYTNNIKRMTIAAAGTVNVVGDITANNFAGRNRIINGDFAIWQRGTSFSPGANLQVYTADRFFMNRNGVSEWTVSRQGYSEQYSCRVQRNVSTTSTQAMRVRQVLESANCGGIVGETVTLSCEIKVGANFSAASSNVTLTIAQGSGNDETGTKMATGFTGVVTTSSAIVGTTSWAKYSVTSGVIGSTISQLGVLIEATPVGTAGANDWYEVRNIQLEVGATATEFEVRSVGNTLDLCQRYYNNASSITVNGNTAGMSANVTNGINYHAVVTFPVAMRAPPTLVWTDWSSSRFPTTAATFQVVGNLGANAYKGANSTGAGYFLGGYTATAEL